MKVVDENYWKTKEGANSQGSIWYLLFPVVDTDRSFLWNVLTNEQKKRKDNNNKDIIKKERSWRPVKGSVWAGKKKKKGQWANNPN